MGQRGSLKHLDSGKSIHILRQSLSLEPVKHEISYACLCHSETFHLYGQIERVDTSTVTQRVQRYERTNVFIHPREVVETAALSTVVFNYTIYLCLFLLWILSLVGLMID